jgi:hypothetical protein
LRLRPSNNTLGFSKQRRDYFLPSNYRTLDVRDEGLGSSAAIVLPAQPNTSTPRLLFTGGKDGFVYLLNRDNLGGVDGQVHKLALFNKPTLAYHDGIRATPAYFDAAESGRFLFVAADEEGPHGQKGMVALRLEPAAANGPMRVRLAWSLKQPLVRPTSPIVSSNGSSNGIVWLVEWRGDGKDVPSALRAFDALDGRDLYNSDNGTPDDRLMGARRFVGPVVANGHVFVGTHGVSCYGLVSRPLPTPTPVPTTAPTPTPASTSSASAASATPTPTPTPLASVEGTIVSVRGNILVVKPILRLSRTRVAFGSKTEVSSYRRADRSILKIGGRVEMGGPIEKDKPWSLNFIVTTPRPLAWFEKKGGGMEDSPDGSWRSGKARIVSLKPFQVRDDKGKMWSPSLVTLRGTWVLEGGGRDTLLIGTKIYAQGIASPDGVIAATAIYPTAHARSRALCSVLSLRALRLRVPPSPFAAPALHARRAPRPPRPQRFVDATGVALARVDQDRRQGCDLGREA